MLPAKKKFMIIAAGGAAIIVYALAKLVLTLNS